MKRVIGFWKIIVLDVLGLVFMIAALLTGWLPGPGGVPLFIIGLSLLAINHTWAERYIDLLKKYADKLGDVIFVKNPAIQLLYDATAPIVLAVGVFFLARHSAWWLVSLGIFLTFAGITFLLGNRGRWQKLKRINKQSN